MLSRIYAVSAVLLFLLFNLIHPAAAQYQSGIPVLLYHHVSDDKTDMPELTISAKEFERQMRLLQDTGFQAISLDEFLTYMKGQQIKLPDKPVVISFDDGYEDNYTTALPILEKFRFKAALFMVGINFDREKRLSRPQIREMAANGFSIEGHSMTHPDLTSLDDKSLQREVAECKELAEQTTRRQVDAFAYPGGFYNLKTVQAVESAGYQCAFTVLTGLNRPDRDNIFLLRRIPIFRSTDFDKLTALLAADQPKTSLLQYDLTLPEELQAY